MILITGGAGFIGSAVAKRLAKKVVVFDDFSSGAKENLAGADAVVVKGGVEDFKAVAGLFADFDFDCVYHFAADPDVRSNTANPRKSFEVNALGTLNVLEAMRVHDVKQIVFASSSVVYGDDAETVPTPETAPVQPISNYGASKACGEAYARSFSELYGFEATVLRYANIFGPPSRLGVLHDFFLKLKKNKNELEVLGDGNQTKSYLFIDDCVEATLLAARKQRKLFDAFNIGSEEALTVKEVASVLCGVLDVEPAMRFTGGERGWAGDVKKMFLDTKKIKALGWKPKTPFREGVGKYVSWLREAYK